MEELLAILLPVLMQIESGADPSAIGDGGAAVGVLQLHKIYVDDVNRIAGTDYTYADRKDGAKSLEMVMLYLTHYGRRYEKLFGEPVTPEVLARIHNGGPNGWSKLSTLKYWQKVQKEMDHAGRSTASL